MLGRGKNGTEAFIPCVGLFEAQKQHLTHVLHYTKNNLIRLNYCLIYCIVSIADILNNSMVFHRLHVWSLFNSLWSSAQTVSDWRDTQGQLQQSERKTVLQSDISSCASWDQTIKLTYNGSISYCEGHDSTILQSVWGALYTRRNPSLHPHSSQWQLLGRSRTPCKHRAWTQRTHAVQSSLE